MKFENKSILLVSPEPWEHQFVSKHHYAVHLAKRNNKVYFLGPPSSKFKLEKSKIENLLLLNYTGFPKGFRFYPDVIQKIITKRIFQKIENLIDQKLDVIWSFDNSVFFNLDGIPDRVCKISHIVDLNQDFQLNKAAKTSDLCLAVIPKIESKLSLFNENTHVISHGLNEDAFTLIKNIPLPGINKIKALYMGNLHMPYIDWELCKKISDENLNVDFIFIGNLNGRLSHIDDVFSKKNVFHIHQINAEQIPSFLNSADILMNLYMEEYYSTFASPHKILEYLASGKAIISLTLQEYSNLDKDLIIISENEAVFRKKFKDLAKNLTYFNSKEICEKRKEIAFQQSYKNKILQIEDLLDS